MQPLAEAEAESLRGVRRHTFVASQSSQVRQSHLLKASNIVADENRTSTQKPNFGESGKKVPQARSSPKKQSSQAGILIGSAATDKRAGLPKSARLDHVVFLLGGRRSRTRCSPARPRWIATSFSYGPHRQLLTRSSARPAGVRPTGTPTPAHCQRRPLCNGHQRSLFSLLASRFSENDDARKEARLKALG
jgi:hypothetical protein